MLIFNAIESLEPYYVAKLVLASGLVYCVMLYVLRSRRATCFSGVSLKGKTALVTGATGGIGYETAKDLANRDCRVIVTGRNHLTGLKAIEKLSEETGNNNIAYRQLDLCSLTSVKHFAALINALEPRLDILVNNAGIIGSLSREVTEDGLEKTFQVNYFAPFLLTNLLLDLMQRTNSSRVVNVSSIAHKWTTIRLDRMEAPHKPPTCAYLQHKAYFDSKCALVCFSNELHSRINKPGSRIRVTFNSLHPGTVNTMLFSTYPFYIRIFIDIFGWLFWKSPVEGAQTTIYVAVSKDLNNVSGSYFSECHINQENNQCLDKEFRKKLWTLSTKYVNLAQSMLEVQEISRSVHSTCVATRLLIDEDTNLPLPESVVSEVIIGIQARMMLQSQASGKPLNAASASSTSTTSASVQGHSEPNGKYDHNKTESSLKQRHQPIPRHSRLPRPSADSTRS